MPLIRPRAPLAALSALGALLAVPSLADARQAPPPTEPKPAAPPVLAPASQPTLARKPGPSPVLAGDKLRGPKGFKVDLIYTVPRDSQGSWVNLAVDPKGRLIASDQYGKLYRVTPPPLDSAPDVAPTVEPIAVDIGEAQGLLWAFDSLYVVVNTGGKFPSGLYRVTDTNGDDKLDKVELLRKLEGSGEHGPHGVVLAPDGKSLYVVAGNATKLPDLAGSLVPRTWGEDNLLPRLPDGNGFMRDEKAPGGYICRVSPDGKDWTLQSMGYRNAFDLAFNREGDLFTYDSDMEWDMNTPWYRPTRVCQAAPGADFGYRNGAGKWPVYYLDSLPPVVNIGPGSPTGVTFGYGAKFPVKYQDALYLCDWSYGKLYAAHLAPEGSSYKATVEEFITGAPLPLTDIVVNPLDGAMYFAVGGRKVTSGLYRVKYTGDEPTAPSTAPLANADLRQARRAIEAKLGGPAPTVANADLDAIMRALGDPDRFVRNAARAWLEFQPTADLAKISMSRAEQASPRATLAFLLALSHSNAADPAHRPKDAPAPDPAIAARIFEALDKLDWSGLDAQQRLEVIRVTEVVLNRFGRPSDEIAAKLVAKYDAILPSPSRDLNVEVGSILVYLQAPSAAAKLVALLDVAPTQEEQMEYGRELRVLKAGWTPELRQRYFTWFARTGLFKGGPSLGGFLKMMKADAVASLSDAERAELKPVIDQAPMTKGAATAAVSAANLPPRAFVKAWTLDDLLPVVEPRLAGKRDFDRGRSLFAAAACSACHRYNDEGGAVGPDLTGVSGRFSTRDLLESIVLPSKTISDQYGAVTIATSDGKVVTGRIMNLHGDNLTINTNMLDPSAQVNVNVNKIEENIPATISMMPEGLLSTLNEDEVADLVAYLLSRGERSAPMFR